MKAIERNFVCEVKNLPRYQMERYVVVRLVNGQMWFWGTFAEKGKAEKCASELENGTVVERAKNED